MAAERLYLTGFMGAGKTAVGRRLAAELGWEFVDLDAEVEADAGLPVAEIFSRWGEERFRREERRALERTLARQQLVVATGGGTLAQPGARELLRGRGVLVWLKAPFARLAARVEAAGTAARPLFGDRRQAEALYRRRLPFYRQADMVVEIGAGEGVEEIVARLRAALEMATCAT